MDKKAPIPLRNAVMRTDKTMDLKNLPKHRASRTSKIFADKYNLPKYVYVSKDGETVVGFRINKLLIVQKDGTNKLYTKMFADPKLSLEKLNEMAVKHLDDIRAKYVTFE